MRWLTVVVGLLFGLPSFASPAIVVTGSFESRDRCRRTARAGSSLFSKFCREPVGNQVDLDLGKAKAEIVEAKVQDETLFRVRIGPFDDSDSAQQVQREASRQGFKETWVYFDNPSEQEKRSARPSKPERVLPISEQASVEISRFIYQAPALQDDDCEPVTTNDNGKNR